MRHDTSKSLTRHNPAFRRWLLAAAIGFLACLAAANNLLAAKPNIVLIFADDKYDCPGEK